MAIYIYFLATLVLCQSICVFARPQDDQFDIDSIFGQQPPTAGQPPAGTTTTTPSPRFSNCVTQCRSQITSEYNPVCGTNTQSYPNPNHLRCDQRCGLSVEVSHIGTCRSTAGG